MCTCARINAYDLLQPFEGTIVRYYLIHLGRFGKQPYARVLLNLLLSGVETVPAQGKREKEVLWQGASLCVCVNVCACVCVCVFVCECERRAR